MLSIIACFENLLITSSSNHHHLQTKFFLFFAILEHPILQILSRVIINTFLTHLFKNFIRFSHILSSFYHLPAKKQKPFLQIKNILNPFAHLTTIIFFFTNRRKHKKERFEVGVFE